MKPDTQLGAALCIHSASYNRFTENDKINHDRHLWASTINFTLNYEIGIVLKIYKIWRLIFCITHSLDEHKLVLQITKSVGISVKRKM